MGVSRELSVSFKVFERSSKGNLEKFQGCSKKVFNVVQGSSKGVSREFQGCFKKVSRVLN